MSATILTATATINTYINLDICVGINTDTNTNYLCHISV